MNTINQVCLDFKFFPNLRILTNCCLIIKNFFDLYMNTLLLESEMLNKNAYRQQKYSRRAKTKYSEKISKPLDSDKMHVIIDDEKVLLCLIPSSHLFHNTKKFLLIL